MCGHHMVSETSAPRFVLIFKNAKKRLKGHRVKIHTDTYIYLLSLALVLSIHNKLKIGGSRKVNWWVRNFCPV